MNSPRRIHFPTDIHLRPRSSGSAVPLTAMQLYYWNYIAEHGGRAQRNVWAVRRIVGPLQIQLLKKALEFLVIRHETLRTRIAVAAGVPTQTIDADRSCTLEVLDLSEIHTGRREQELERLCKEFLAEEIDPTVGPLFAARLFRLSGEESVLLFALDHLISDRASNVIIHNELWTLYQQAVQGASLQLPELPVQFADYAIWQHETYAALRADHEEYWRGRLSGIAPIKLPQDGTGSDHQEPVYLVSEFPFGTELTAELVKLARNERTLLPYVVLAVYALAMARWCKRGDLLILFLTHARYRPETKSLVGFLASVLPLRINIEEGDGASSFLNRVNQEVCSAFAHLDFDWSDRSALLEAMTEIGFNWIPSDAMTKPLTITSETEIPLSIEPFGLTVHWPYPLVIFFYDAKAEVILKITYRPDAYSSPTIDLFGHDLLECAETFVHRPLDPISMIR